MQDRFDATEEPANVGFTKESHEIILRLSGNATEDRVDHLRLDGSNDCFTMRVAGVRQA